MVEKALLAWRWMGGTPASGVGGTRCRGGYTGGTRLLPEDPAPPVTLPLSLCSLSLADGRAPPLGGESDKDRRPDDKSFMVLGPHVDGATTRNMHDKRG